mgnify:CR=1 FL=1
MKLDELVCATAWAIVFTSGEGTENEKQRVRAMRAFYKMDAERFNAANKDVLFSDMVAQVKNSDPITKILSIYGSLKVAKEEFEDSADGERCSDEEWEKITQLIDATNINREIRDAIRVKAYDLINTISAPENIDDEDVMELLGFEMEDTRGPYETREQCVERSIEIREAIEEMPDHIPQAYKCVFNEIKIPGVAT